MFTKFFFVVRFGTESSSELCCKSLGTSDLARRAAPRRKSLTVNDLRWTLVLFRLRMSSIK